jgi:transposase
MGFIQGEGRTQGTLFPVTLEELIPQDHVCRVIDAFVDRLDIAGLGFERADPADTGRPGYDPRDLLKLYLYGYLQQVRSSRRLENECRRNVEVMWLLRRLVPDHKSIAEFRRMHSEAVTQVGAELIRFARSLGLVRGEWVALDGSKFRAVSSVGSVREREAVKRYLEALESGDQDDELVVEPSKVAEALKKLQEHREPEAHFMRATTGAKVPAYNVQSVVDSQHALIVAQQVTMEATDNRCLLPMAEAAQAAVGGLGQVLHVVADAGYSNGEQAEACEAKGILPHVPANRGVNNQGDGKLFDRSAFLYQPEQDRFLCPAGQTLKRQQISRKDRSVYYAGRSEVCGACPLKSRCTVGAQRMVSRHWHDEALQRMQQRATPELMRLRRSTVEHPFATLKYHIFGHPRFLLRGRRGAQAEISLAIIVYNLKRMMNVLGPSQLAAALTPA